MKLARSRIAGVGTGYANGVTLIVSLDSSNAWTIGFFNSKFDLNKGDTFAIDVLIDGQRQARLVGTALAKDFVRAILPASPPIFAKRASWQRRHEATHFSSTCTRPIN